MVRKIINRVFWFSVFTGTIVLLSFVSESQSEVICKNLDIEIDYSSGMYFVNIASVENKLKESALFPPGRKMHEINLNKIENSIREIPEVKNVDVFKSMDGVVGIRITQRVPLIRVFNRNGSQFFIDTDGKQMQVTGSFYPRVLVANGYIMDPSTDLTAQQIASNEDLNEYFKSDDLYKISKYISGNEFWNAQIQEIYFNMKGEIELIPLVGQHRIIFGDAEHIEEKFNKLFRFYKEGLKKSGWNKYDTINLKFKKQIICTKTNTE